MAVRGGAQHNTGARPAGVVALAHEDASSPAPGRREASLSAFVQVAETGDRAVARVAAAQHGVVTRAQLEAIGFGRGAIAHRLAQARLHRLHRGVYLVGHPVAPPLARELAALLACGPGAVLSHRTAGELWGLLPAGEGNREVDITVVGRNPRHPGIRVHRVRRLEARHLMARRGIPVTAPARTLLDLADVLPPRALERAVDEAQVSRRVRHEDLLAVLAEANGRHGAPALRAVLEREGGPAITRSEAEERLLALLRRAGLPPPRVNVRLAGHEVDLFWPDQGVVIEIDGYAFHSSRAAFERDRVRDAQLQAIGLRVMRVTWRQIVAEPEALLVRIAQLLAARPPIDHPPPGRTMPVS